MVDTNAITVPNNARFDVPTAIVLISVLSVNFAETVPARCDVLQHVDASAAVVHVVPAQSVLSLLESLTLPEPHELRLEHLALVGAALQHVDVSTLASHVAPAHSVLSLAVSFVNPLLHCCNLAHFWGVAVQQYDAHTDTGHPVFDLAGSGTLPGYCAQSAVVTIEQVAFTEVP
jgi:hypothetical protein